MIPKDKVQYTHTIFKNVGPKLLITIRKENNKSNYFFNISAKYNNKDEIETNWFIKEIWSRI